MNPAAQELATLTPGRDFDFVVVGGSAGAFAALRAILPALNCPQLTAIIVVHQAAHGGDLADLFNGVAALPCCTVEDKEPARPGAIYFAPAGYHLLMERDGHFALSVDAPINYSRPSIDVLFESIAATHGQRVAALLLTGANEDGAHGLKCVADAGGIALVQDPAEAEVAMMPTSALRLSTPRAVLTLAQIAEVFAAWSNRAGAHA